MFTTVTRRYHFEAAHFLPKVPETHKCHNVHGHNYEVEVTCRGAPDSRGFILDFFEMDAIIAPLVKQCDHCTLNDVPGLENPTAELIAAWFLRKLTPTNIAVERIRVYETKDCWAEVER